MDWNNMLHMDGEAAEAAFALLQGPIPDGMTYERDGRGGAKLTYLPHHIANRLLLTAFGPFFSWEILEIKCWGEKMRGEEVVPSNARATGRLTFYVKVGDQVVEKRGTGVGSFDNTMKLAHANAEAAAASMALPKALIRVFGFGLESYEGANELQPSLTPKGIWNLMLDHAKRVGVSADTLTEAAKNCGIPQEQWPMRWVAMIGLVDRLAEQSQAGVVEPETPKGPAEEEPGADPFSMPETPTEDPLVQAAIEELGATVVGGPDWGWGEFFQHCADELGVGSPTEANKRLDAMYGNGQRPKPKREMFEELKANMGKANDTDASPESQPEIPF